MKRYFKMPLIIMIMIFMILPQKPANAGILEIVKAAVVKAIKAADLKIQRLQNKTIWLQNAQKELENIMAKLKLKEISDWGEKQRKQYDDYFKELWRVKNAIATYQKVKDIMQRQLLLVEEYKKAWTLLQADKNFSPQELKYMFTVYTGLLEESLKNLDQLAIVANSFKTQMTDGERLELLSRTGDNMESVLTELRGFSDRNFRMSLSRAKDFKESERLKKMYGLK